MPNCSTLISKKEQSNTRPTLTNHFITTIARTEKQQTVPHNKAKDNQTKDFPNFHRLQTNRNKHKAATVKNWS